MRNKTLLALFAAVALCCSCEKADPELGEFQVFESYIDMSQTNKFRESFLYKHWTLSKVTYETYVDGVLVDSRDDTQGWGLMEYSFRSDHTMSYGSDNGSWLYSHNNLMWKVYGFYYCLEVLKLNAAELILKVEDIPLGIPHWTLFWEDNSGTHCFEIFQFN